MADAPLIYEPPLSAAGYLMDEKFISMIIGPYGSTKTTASLMKIAYHASRMAASPDGVRRSRAVWVRNTREQLRDSSIPDFLQWFPDGVAGTFEKTNYNFILRFSDVECLVMFRGLDDQQDVRRLLSLQLSFGILDEVREINEHVFEALQGRLGRYPSKAVNGVGCVCDDGTENKHLWGATNPPDMDTFWEKFFSNPPDNAHVFFQPSGLSPEADWRQWLPADYYENLAEGKTQDWIDIYINAQFGRSLAGRPVFPDFKPDFHVSKTTLKPLQSQEKPLIIGMDFGLNPSVTINQLDFHGRLLTFDALTSSGMGVLRFCQTVLKPHLAQKYPAMPVVIVGDPAGAQRSQSDERTCFDILKDQGFRAIGAKTNSIVGRIAAVEGFLARQIDGGPGWLIDPSARAIITAMRGGYRYKTKRNGEAELTPEKNDSSHIADAQQYACLHAFGGMWGTLMDQPRRDVVRVSSLGWT